MPKPDDRIVRVAVTGHRRIDDPAAVAGEVRRALAGLRRAAPPGPHSERSEDERHLELLSALAEGADRLVAAEALLQPGTTLVAVLPLAAGEYEQDFGDASRHEFRALLACAGRREALPPAPTRPESYARAGQWCIEHCDVLLALWDGLEARGRGGTAEIVAFAVARGVPVYWITTNRGPVAGGWLLAPQHARAAAERT